MKKNGAGILSALSLVFLAVSVEGVEIHKLDAPSQGLRGGRLSGDGLVVAGVHHYNSSQYSKRLFRWTVAGGLEVITPSGNIYSAPSVVDVNYDGSAFIGGSGSPFLWTTTNFIEHVTVYGRKSGFPKGISAGGGTVVGDAGTTGTGFYCFRYEDGAYTEYDDMGNQIKFYRFGDVSANGRYVVVSAQIPPAYGDRTLGIYDFDTGALNALSGSSYLWSAVEMSADATAVIGTIANSINAFRWKVGASNTVEILGHIDPTRATIPSDLNADGSIIVGRGLLAAGPTAFVWDETSGIRSLVDYLYEHGADTNGLTLADAVGISDDGDAILAVAGYMAGSEYGDPILITGLNDPIAPTIESMVSSGSNFDFVFNSVVGQHYWIEGTPSIVSQVWNSVSTTNIGNGAAITSSLSVASFPETNFYFRAVTQPTP